MAVMALHFFKEAKYYEYCALVFNQHNHMCDNVHRVCHFVVNVKLEVVVGLWHTVMVMVCLQCFDTVGWVAGRASGL